MITNKEEESFTLTKEQNIGELIEKLTIRYPKMERVLLSNQGDTLKNTISVSVNHSIIKADDPLSEPLGNKDVVAFLLPVSGG